MDQTKLHDCEQYMLAEHWGQHLRALRFHRDNLTEQEKGSGHKEAIMATKKEYYEVAVEQICDWLKNREKRN